VGKLTKEQYRKKIIEILQVYEDDETITINDVVNQIMDLPIPEIVLENNEE